MGGVITVGPVVLNDLLTAGAAYIAAGFFIDGAILVFLVVQKFDLTVIAAKDANGWVVTVGIMAMANFFAAGTALEATALFIDGGIRTLMRNVRNIAFMAAVAAMGRISAGGFMSSAVADIIAQSTFGMASFCAVRYPGYLVLAGDGAGGRDDFHLRFAAKAGIGFAAIGGFGGFDNDRFIIEMLLLDILSAFNAGEPVPIGIVFYAIYCRDVLNFAKIAFQTAIGAVGGIGADGIMLALVGQAAGGALDVVILRIIGKRGIGMNKVFNLTFIPAVYAVGCIGAQCSMSINDIKLFAATGADGIASVGIVGFPNHFLVLALGASGGDCFHLGLSALAGVGFAAIGGFRGLNDDGFAPLMGFLNVLFTQIAEEPM